MLHQCAGIGVYGWDYLVLTGEQFITQLLSTLFTSQLLYISLTESVLHLYPSRADSQHIFVTFCMITTLNCFFTQALKSKQLASYLTQYRQIPFFLSSLFKTHSSFTNLAHHKKDNLFFHSHQAGTSGNFFTLFPIILFGVAII